MFCEEAAAWLDANEKHVVALHCKVKPPYYSSHIFQNLKAGKGRAGMMACMLLLRMNYSATAAEAIDRYNRERVRDRRGLTVLSQRKWINYYAALLAEATVPRYNFTEPSFAVLKLTLNNTLTAKKLPKLRLRIFTLAPDGTKTLLHQEIGYNQFEMRQEIRGCILIEFYREQANGCLRTRHFRIWFHTYFLKPDKKTGSVKFSRSEMDWTARDMKYRRLPAAFELKLIVEPCDANMTLS
ncbi:hypothetical protein PsorP6_009398 [Peronosclerospora sorghi]|uniref:Uncharacterized protein n=2 Tax=Peronosclerospora sorghi TaxID=230839 RepID=A0ACC0VYA6_9STRA|nr:hypothetical protein PsorP6_009407 [Peronosclerospora sorghi]KAI9912106.1 hypothetical protein PsorP6_009398 [Peronosclerospora sorghi]